MGSARNISGKNGGEAALYQRRKALVEKGEASKVEYCFCHRQKQTNEACCDVVIKS